MAACKYRLVSTAIEPGLQGHPMRRLVFKALPSEPFGDGNAHPDGTISQLVTPEAAKGFSIGDEFFVMFRETET